MSKPSVKVKEKEYSVDRISVVLKLNSGPLIHLGWSEKLGKEENQPSNEDTFKEEFFQNICQEEECSFQWGGTTLKFILVGAHSSEERTFELVGLVVKKDLIDWFNQNNLKDKKEDYLIYQKSKGKNTWPFLNKVLGDKFKQPSQDFVEKIKLLFPENGCIWRYRDSNNFHFLNRAIAFASRHLPEVQGWCAFDDADKPLRLILFEEKKQDQTIPKLDQKWTPSSYPFLPNRYSWNRWLDKSSTLTCEPTIKDGQKMALIKKLVSHGSNSEDGKSFQAQNPKRLLFVPGTITIGERNIFCHTVTYEFKKESPLVTMKIEVDYPERQIGDNEVLSLRLPGKFKEWHQQKDGETEVKIAPSELKNWGIIDEKDQSLKSGNDAFLYTQILSPTYSDKKYSGIYIKHEKDDEMIVDIHPCDIPLVLGSVQKYRQELEEADVTLSGEKLAISVSEHNQSLDKSEAIILDNSEIKLNHGKKIFGQAQKNIDFLSQNIELGSTQIDINSGQTKINSLVNVSFPSPKVPTPNVPGSPGVAKDVNSNVIGLPGGGVSKSDKIDGEKTVRTITTVSGSQFNVGQASGTNNLCLLDSLSQLLTSHTGNDITQEQLTNFLVGAGLIQVGGEQDFYNPDITEAIAAQYDITLQAHIRNGDGTITDAPPIGNQGQTLHLLHETLGENTHHFSPLFPSQQKSPMQVDDSGYSSSDSEYESSDTEQDKGKGKKLIRAIRNFTKEGNQRTQQPKVNNKVEKEDLKKAKAQLNDDAKQIHDVIPKKRFNKTKGKEVKNQDFAATTISTAILKDKTGSYKKFVFTNLEGAPPPDIRQKAHDLGYHVVASRKKSHAEGQQIQFVDARGTRYELVSQGCDKDHCTDCNWAMTEYYGDNYPTTAQKSDKTFRKWYQPPRLIKAVGENPNRKVSLKRKNSESKPKHGRAKKDKKSDKKD